MGRKRQRALKQSIHEVLWVTRCRYVGLHPDIDFGDRIQGKHKDVMQLAYGNINGFPATIINNSKVSALHGWLRKYDMDGFFGVEGNINWRKMPPYGCLDEFFRSETALRTVASFNTHKNLGRKQQCGTFALACGQLASTVRRVGMDDTGLGQWSWMCFQGRDGHVARVVVTYVPCSSKSTKVGTVFLQHCWYLDSVGQ